MEISKTSTVKLRSGRRMPALGLGTWQLNQDTVSTIMYALDLGYKMIDTASDYGTQPSIGEAIRRSGIPRSDVYIVTKVEEDDDAYEASKDYVSEMGLEYADLILIHRPPQDGAGEELWRGLIAAKGEGFARDIGVSNYYDVEMIHALVEETGELPAVNQVEWSPFGFSEDMLAYAKRNGIVLQAYSPLTRANRLNDETLQDIAKHHNKTPAQVLIRWNLQLGTVPLPKANQRIHLEENINVFDFELSQDEMTRLKTLNEEYSALSRSPLVFYA